MLLSQHIIYSIISPWQGVRVLGTHIGIMLICLMLLQQHPRWLLHTLSIRFHGAFPCLIWHMRSQHLLLVMPADCSLVGVKEDLVTAHVLIIGRGWGGEGGGRVLEGGTCQENGGEERPCHCSDADD